MARVDSMGARVLVIALLIITLSCTSVLSAEFVAADENVTENVTNGCGAGDCDDEGYGEPHDPAQCAMKCGVKAFPCGLGCIPQGPIMVPCIVKCAIEAFKCLADCVAGGDPKPGPIPTPPLLPPLLPPKSPESSPKSPESPQSPDSPDSPESPESPQSSRLLPPKVPRMH